jgi:hypothetical protein
MKTNRISRIVTNLVLALAGAFIFAGVANAQVVCAGKFTLPFEARWDRAVLPAGDYSFTLDSVEPFARIQLYRGTKAVALIQSGAYDEVSSGASALTVVSDSAGNTVRDLSLPEIGMVFHYAPHKSRQASAAAEREISQTLPVTSVAGTGR